MPHSVPAQRGATSIQASSKPKRSSKCRATELRPRWERALPDEPLSFDAEFVNYRYINSCPNSKNNHRLGRVTLVNRNLETVLDTFVYYSNEDNIKKSLPDARHVKTIRPADLVAENGAQPAHKVEVWIAELVRNRVIIMHSGTHDRTAFYLRPNVFQDSTIIDTQHLFSSAMGWHAPGLANTVARFLKRDIQKGSHCSVEDAVATMELYQLHGKGLPDGKGAEMIAATSDWGDGVSWDVEDGVGLGAEESKGADTDAERTGAGVVVDRELIVETKGTQTDGAQSNYDGQSCDKASVSVKTAPFWLNPEALDFTPRLVKVANRNLRILSGPSAITLLSRSVGWNAEDNGKSKDNANEKDIAMPTCGSERPPTFVHERLGCLRDWGRSAEFGMSSR